MTQQIEALKEQVKIANKKLEEAESNLAVAQALPDEIKRLTRRVLQRYNKTGRGYNENKGRNRRTRYGTS